MDFSKLQATSKVVDEWAYPLVPPHATGLLPVDRDPDHALYWEAYGNPDGEPVMFLHGGPGGACAPAMSRFFDPARYRTILFDQRGCGKSQPTVASAGPQVALAKNTTDDLVADINRLRDHLEIAGPMHVFGGSWGSTLALVYGIRHPEHCASLVLRGIFLGSEGDIDYLYQGNAATYHEAPFALTQPGSYFTYPDEWAAFLAPIPPQDRGHVRSAYKTIFDRVPANDAERAQQLKAALAWSQWEGAISNMIPDTADTGKFGEADFALCFAQIEAHFFANDLFLPPDYILDNVARLKGVPVHIVHGRFDQVCPLTQASRLAQALTEAGAPPATFVMTTAGHSAMERETVLALTAIMDGLPRIQASSPPSAGGAKRGG